MERIVAEEIRDFDTSLDRLWHRRDLVVVVTGALICLRSIHRRAMQVGASARFRYARIRAEDYVFGTAEEEIRRAVRDAAHLDGVRAIVIYLSCPDILTRPDFADIERSLSAETGCAVRCFFRGPLAKADGAPHETAAEILAGLPQETGAVAAAPPLPPPMSDIAGVSDFLRAAGGANVLVTPAGCRNALTRMDLTAEQRDVYALIPKAADYIFGMEETAAEEVGALAAEGHYRAVHLIGSPVPAFMAMDAEEVLHAAAERGCCGHSFPTDGFRDAVRGVAEATLHLIEEAAARWDECGQTAMILGYSALLFGDPAQLDAPIAELSALGYDVCIAGRDPLAERPALVWSVSAAGETAAAWLHARYGTPIIRTLPLGAAGRAAWRARVRRVCGRAGAEAAPVRREIPDRMERILIIGDPIAARAIGRELAAHGCHRIAYAAYAWSAETAALYRAAMGTEELLCFSTEEELRPAWDAADIAVADPALIPVMGEKRILPLPCGFLSGRDAAGAGSGVLGTRFAAVLQDVLSILQK